MVIFILMEVVSGSALKTRHVALDVNRPVMCILESMGACGFKVGGRLH